MLASHQSQHASFPDAVIDGSTPNAQTFLRIEGMGKRDTTSVPFPVNSSQNGPRQWDERSHTKNAQSKRPSEVQERKRRSQLYNSAQTRTDEGIVAQALCITDFLGA